MNQHDPFDPTALETARGKRKQADRKVEQQIADDLKWLMQDKRGRRFMWRLLETTGLYKSSFTGNSQTFFLEGQRNIGLIQMDALLAHCRDEYLTMVSEQKNGN